MANPYPSLAIGGVAGGPGANREWWRAVMRLGRRVVAIRDGVTSPLALNVIFQIPGTNLQPDFDGIRTGRCSRKEARLLVQVALPATPPADLDKEVLGLLREAILIGEEFARQEGMIEGQLTDLRKLLERL